VSGLKILTFRGQELVMPVPVNWWIPSAARSGLALGALWLFDGIFFSCLNLALTIRSRHVIRVIFAVVAGNALVLAIFGIVQKLVESKGIYFGLVRSPQDYFFASFVYDNHWGAFMILMTGACLGLVLRYVHGAKGEGFFRGPALTGAVATCLLACTIPYSGARACTLLVGIILFVALVRGIPQISGALKESGASTPGIYAGITAAIALAVAGVWMIAGDVIEARTDKTREQVSSIWAAHGLGTRGVLYHDTWRMARDRLAFGWGMGSYPTVFTLYNSLEPNSDGLPQIYHDAHSDWLQSVSEIGVVGTALIGAAVLIPLLSVRRSRFSPIPFFLLLGCALVAAYAWIEFPFGNVAVVLSWWLCFFGAVQYVRLTAISGGAKPRT
jgi:O-antigen ligase